MANALNVSTDYLMNGTTADPAAENINDKTLINQINMISELSEENKTVVSKLIDAFLFQQEMKLKLSQKKQELMQDNKENSHPDLLKEHLPLPTRRKLIPWWIKIFIWIFIVFGAIVPVAVVFGFMDKEISIALYGLKTNQPFSLTGLLLIVIFAVKAILSFALWFEKKWAIQLGMIDVLLGIPICIGAFIWNLTQSINTFFPVDIIFLIIFLIWLRKTAPRWH